MTIYAGIDAGGTLIKIARLGDPGNAAGRGPAGKPALLKFPAARIEDAARWVRANLPEDARIGVTGGRGERLRGLLPEYANFAGVPEFEATAEGAVRIRACDLGEAGKAAERFVLANVGTGTSLHLIDGAERPRLGGIGLGGGTIVGLTGLLCGVRDYDEIARLAPLGDREAVDLTVGQIYAPAEPPIAGDLTAANFARPLPSAAAVRPQDYAAAVVGMVAEIVATVAAQAAALHGASRIVYAGSAYEGNELLRTLTVRFTHMLGRTAEIPPQGPYCGAIGALYAAKESIQDKLKNE
ncbi:type II pantothenate kinase [Saccharibacillus sp. CPCC 101409]|uniref:type II pantothenate kinase n=1 Tax=Saccharibacillus sp. CPCC 101409 TaxID=3058041 RepID=UPI0026732F00|nr:type II pantothenate kinase [Saccharibacillus sp. CPCC 101409]MDO3411472.1 type II pantothenate kinase [Saccharibacillus sp. CPCC 101409]